MTNKHRSFNWYGLSQRFSLRKYHVGTVSVLLGLALANTLMVTPVQAEEGRETAGEVVNTSNSVETETRTITRTIGYNKVDEKYETTPVAPTIKREVVFERFGTNNGSSETVWGDWSPKNGDKTLEGAQLPEIPGYAPKSVYKNQGQDKNQILDPTITEQDIDVTADTQNIDEIVTYVPAEHKTETRTIKRHTIFHRIDPKTKETISIFSSVDREVIFERKGVKIQGNSDFNWGEWKAIDGKDSLEGVQLPKLEGYKPQSVYKDQGDIKQQVLAPETAEKSITVSASDASINEVVTYIPVEVTKETKKVTRRINYIKVIPETYEVKTAAPDSVQTLTLERIGTKIYGSKDVNWGEWEVLGDSKVFKGVSLPVVKGYKADTSDRRFGKGNPERLSATTTAEDIDVTGDTQDIFETVIYKPTVEEKERRTVVRTIAYKKLIPNSSRTEEAAPTVREERTFERIGTRFLHKTEIEWGSWELVDGDRILTDERVIKGRELPDVAGYKPYRAERVIGDQKEDRLDPKVTTQSLPVNEETLNVNETVIYAPFEEKRETKTVKRTIVYNKIDNKTYETSQAAETSEQEVVFERVMTKLFGEFNTTEVIWSDWKPKNNDNILEGVALPVVPGFKATISDRKIGNGASVRYPAETTSHDIEVTEKDNNILETVTYAPAVIEKERRTKTRKIVYIKLNPQTYFTEEVTKPFNTTTTFERIGTRLVGSDDIEWGSWEVVDGERILTGARVLKAQPLPIVSGYVATTNDRRVGDTPIIRLKAETAAQDINVTENSENIIETVVYAPIPKQPESLLPEENIGSNDVNKPGLQPELSPKQPEGTGTVKPSLPQPESPKSPETPGETEEAKDASSPSDKRPDSSKEETKPELSPKQPESPKEQPNVGGSDNQVTPLSPKSEGSQDTSKESEGSTGKEDNKVAPNAPKVQPGSENGDKKSERPQEQPEGTGTVKPSLPQPELPKSPETPRETEDAKDASSPSDKRPDSSKGETQPELSPKQPESPKEQPKVGGSDNQVTPLPPKSEGTQDTSKVSEGSTGKEDNKVAPNAPKVQLGSENGDKKPERPQEQPEGNDTVKPSLPQPELPKFPETPRETENASSPSDKRPDSSKEEIQPELSPKQPESPKEQPNVGGSDNQVTPLPPKSEGSPDTSKESEGSTGKEDNKVAPNAPKVQPGSENGDKKPERPQEQPEGNGTEMGTLPVLPKISVPKDMAKGTEQSQNKAKADSSKQNIVSKSNGLLNTNSNVDTKSSSQWDNGKAKSNDSVKLLPATGDKSNLLNILLSLSSLFTLYLMVVKKRLK